MHLVSFYMFGSFILNVYFGLQTVFHIEFVCRSFFNFFFKDVLASSFVLENRTPFFCYCLILVFRWIKLLPGKTNWTNVLFTM